MTDWHVGMKVVCIRDLSHCGTQMEMVPQMGPVYTIRELEYGRHVDDRVCLRLREIVNDPCQYRTGFFECSFGCDSFRPVVETEDHVFRERRVPQPETVGLQRFPIGSNPARRPEAIHSKFTMLRKDREASGSWRHAVGIYQGDRSGGPIG